VGLRRGIAATGATPSKTLRPGKPLQEGNNTTHFSVADHEGNAVSITTTLNDYYGAKAAVDGAGFFLNDEMDDFSVKPGVPNNYGLVGGEANSIAPYKRPLSSMSPSLVLKNKKLFLVVGSPGGARIITTVLQVILNVIDFGMNIQEAIDAPRIHHQWLPDELRIEKRGLSQDTLDRLKERGYEVVVRGPMGDVNAILIDQGIMDGAGDPRNEF
ncbi:MAG TPA: gamma-glutamyltransferase, partial [Chroococcales cyanobacterium]